MTLPHCADCIQARIGNTRIRQKAAAALSVLVIFAGTQSVSAQKQTTPDVVLHGVLRGVDNHSYVEVPFDVPAGVSSLTVKFTYDHSEHTTIDLGLFDPERFRGWSGGNKSTFTVGIADATPSYLPGPMPAGRWKLLLGVPNIRHGSVTVYDAAVLFTGRTDAPAVSSFTDVLLREGAGWYRGDLHLHTGHSDGSCTSQRGTQVPCPVFVTVSAAANRGLDFIAITDHNTTSHYGSMRELQPYFDKLLLIPGRELTTFQGHANIFGITEYIDFRLGTAPVASVDSLIQSATRAGALVSINHPSAPAGEMCMGCGWTPNPASDLTYVSAVEAVNGGAESGPYSGIGFWQAQLARGYRLTAIGGSDNHLPEIAENKPGSVGSPTTVVHARGLSVAAILEGIRLGNVFIDLTASSHRLLELTAEAGSSSASMGGGLQALAATTVRLVTHIAGCEGSVLTYRIDDHDDPQLKGTPITQKDQVTTTIWKSDGRRHAIHPFISAKDGALQMLGNPVYINFADSAVTQREQP